MSLCFPSLIDVTGTRSERMMSQMPHDRAAEQRRQVWGACQSILGFGGLIGLIALGYFVVGLLPKSVDPGPDGILFMDARLAHFGVFWCVLFGGAFFLAALARTVTTEGFVFVCLLVLFGAAALIWDVYGHVAAVAFTGRAVELRFIWPRSAV